MHRWLKGFPQALFLIGCLHLSCATNARHEPRPPQARKGIIDVRNWQFELDGPVALSGDYAFYWRKFLSYRELIRPDAPMPDAFLRVPHIWNGASLKGEKLPGQGFGTYRISILLDDPPPTLALKILDFGTSCAAYANGRLVYRAGLAGTVADSSAPSYAPQIVDLKPEPGQLDLVLHVANFSHARGGAWEKMTLGLRSQLYHMRERRLSVSFLLFGSIVALGLYQLTLFIRRRRDDSIVYLAIFCVLVALRLLTTGERPLLYLLPGLGWSMLIKLEYFTFYLAAPILALFLNAVFREVFHQKIMRAIVAVGFAFSAIVVLTPARLFTHTLYVYQSFIALAALYCLAILFMAAWRKREGAAIIFGGFTVLTATVINDILTINGVIHTAQYAALGVFLFVFVQAFMLSFRYRRLFSLIDTQRHELEKTNNFYLREIGERKRAERENRELQERLARSQKMEALGLLAGGVAHDLNNILTAMVSLPELILVDLAKSSPIRSSIEMIKQSGLKAAAIVQDLLTMARRSIVQFEVLNLNALVREYMVSPELEQLKADYPGTNVIANLEETLLNIKGSPFHLRKTIMNLVSNAAEARPRDGQIVVSTMNRYLDKTINGYENIHEGNYAVLRVEDKGIGIGEKDLKKIFEPFYTKKVMGRSGSGLGMAVIWGTVHDHGGMIDVRTREGEGTTFELYFPITEEALAETETTVPIEDFLGKNERILIVDDIAEQREIASQILTRLGYSVSAVGSGEEALEYVKAHDIDLLVLDMVMEPGIDGLETYERVLEVRPHMKAIIASGYSETERVKIALSKGAGSYIKKPYTLEKIGLAVRAELEAPSG